MIPPCAVQAACAVLLGASSSGRTNADRLGLHVAPHLRIALNTRPATPPRSAQEELPYLKSGKIALVRGAGHTSESPCTDALTVQFVRARSTNGLDVTRCNAAFVLPHFTTNM